jgi:hypothetical protein
VFDRPAIHAWIRVKHPEQWSDSEIANGWNELHPDAPLDRRCITLLRNEIGLPPWHSQTERYRRRVAAKTKEQLAKAGLPTIGHLRRQAYAEWCAQAGWPGITRPRLAQILNLLYERGPHTREQIAKAIGMRWEPKGDHPASRCGLSGNGPGGQLYGDPAADGAGRTLGPDGADRARSRAAGQSLRYGSAR